ncbi:MAG: DoxX family protein [Acidobacteriota bacterium]|nr:DoxX family protein [Acidobacteriota bacterium]
MKRWPVALLFTAAGVLHFLLTDQYARVMPPYLPAPRFLVFVSGAAEIAGGLGMLLPITRQAAAWGLIALLIAVFPANIYMAQAHLVTPQWALWARLPLQVLLVWWVFWARKD